MRRFFNFVDALRKVRDKLHTELYHDANIKINFSNGRETQDSKANLDDHIELSLQCDCQLNKLQDDNLKDKPLSECPPFPTSKKKKKHKCHHKSPLPPSPDKEILWQNLKQVLLVCGGQKDPIEQMHLDQGSEELVGVLKAQQFVRDIFIALEVPEDAASDMSDALIAADYMGHRCMGIHRLPAIAADLLNCTVSANATPNIKKENEALALVDGCNAPGPVVGTFCMDLAIQKAQQVGIGWVVASKSNCIGMASWYACQAMEKRLIGLCMSNAAPTVVPNDGIEPILGENPIACAAAGEDVQFLVDFGQSACCIDKLELSYSTGLLKELPSALALDMTGRRETTDVAEALRAQRFYPFFPAYKGFGLAAMVDILCGVMSGSRYATQLRRRGTFSTENEAADLSQLYVAIDPRRFCTSFEERLTDFLRLLCNAMPCNIKSNDRVMVPGDKEMLHMQLVDEEGGLRISPCTLGVLKELADTLRIKPLQAHKIRASDKQT